MSDAKNKPSVSFPLFSIHSECEGRIVRYDLRAIETGVRVEGSSEHDAIGEFANATPCGHFRNQGNEYWATVVRWSYHDIQVVVTAMAIQTGSHTANWISTLMEHYSPTKYPILYQFLLDVLVSYPNSYTIRHLKEWYQNHVFDREPVFLIKLMANKGKRITAWMESYIETLSEEQYRQSNFMTIAALALVIAHYAATDQSPHRAVSRLWRMLTSSDLRTLTRELETVTLYHPIGSKCPTAVIKIADEYYEQTPYDIRQRWTTTRNSLLKTIQTSP